MNQRIKNIKSRIRIFAAKMYRFWFQAEIDEERMRELRADHLKYYYPAPKI